MLPEILSIFFAEKSIEIYKNQVEKLDEHLVCNITFPLNIIQHGFIHKQAKSYVIGMGYSEHGISFYHEC